MRDIKFRIWHKIEKRFLDPYAEENPMMDLIGDVFLYDKNDQGWTNKNCMPKDIVIQQFTGYKDENGKEIYEGDILECCEGEKTVVCWFKAYSGWQWCECELGRNKPNFFYGGLSMLEFKHIICNVFEE